MKVLRGLQKLGNLRTSTIVIDWTYLLQDRGLRKETDDLQKTIGMVLRIFSVAGILALSVFDLSLGKLVFVEVIDVDRPADIAFWLMSFVLVYTTYLLRDRTKFFDTVDIKKLDSLREDDKEKRLPQEIELTDYFDYDILNIFDDLLRENDREFLVRLTDKLVQLPKVKALILRLGLESHQMDEIMKKTYHEMNTSVDTWLHRIIFESFVLAYKNNFETIDEQVVFLSICLIPLKDILIEYKVMPNEVKGLQLWAKNEAKKRRYIRLWKETASLKPRTTVNRAYTSIMASTLEKFKRDFTLEVLMGQFTLSIAREKELENLIRVLQQGEKGAVLLVGDPGVGKTTIIKSLAVRMIVEDVPKELYDKRLIAFDFNKAYATSSSIDRFRGLLSDVFEEVERSNNIILVLDDFDQIVNVREEVASEVINLIVQAISKFNLRIIATSSKNGYLESIKPVKSLVSLFDIIEINEPSDDVAMQILIDSVPVLEREHKIRLSFDALRRAISLSHKYDFDRVLPDKAIDLVEEACVYAQSRGLKFVSESDMEELVSKKVGVKVGALDNEEKGKLAKLEEEMHRKVVGQEQAISAIANALRRSRAGLTSGNRPVASFLFFGPTGVGKTEVAKTLASTYFGDEKLMIRIDMSEYQEEDNLKRLIGYRDGNDFFGGYLTEAVREKPFSLILLDEIEKANPKVLDLFLQILDEGAATDGIGRKVNFTNTIIIATSNAGSKKLAALAESGESYEVAYQKVMPELRSVFRVEFLNRFDQVIMFKPLLEAQIEEIAGLMLHKLSQRLYEKGIMIDFSHNVLRELAKLGYNPVYGARELRRVIQENVEDKVANLIVNGELDAGKKLMINSLSDMVVVD